MKQPILTIGEQLRKERRDRKRRKLLALVLAPLAVGSFVFCMASAFDLT